jgi:ribosome-associated protein
MTATDSALTLARVAAQAAADKLAKDILLVDVSDRLAITDVFVIVTGANERQVGAIVDSVEEKMRAAGTRPPRREGERDGRWVLLDFLDVIVHVQHSEERVFYALDRLWKDCPTIPWTDASGDPGSALADGVGGSSLTAAESVGVTLADHELAALDIADDRGADGLSEPDESETVDGNEDSAADRPGVVASP